MEPISATVLSLALGAGAVAGKELVSGLVKDAYAALKGLIARRYAAIDLAPLEQKPQSKAQRAVVEEGLAEAGAAQDAELLAAARALMQAIEREAPGAAAAIGVDLKDVSAANLRLADVEASGTGVKVERGTFTGDIDIKGVRAGVKPEPKT